MTIKVSLCFLNTTFAPFTSDCTEAELFFGAFPEAFENDLPTCIKINTTDRHSKDWTRTIKTGLIMDMDKLPTKTDFIFPLTHNFAQTLSANTTILLPLDIQDDGKPRKTSPETTGGHACKDKSRSTSLDATLPTHQASQRKTS